MFALSRLARPLRRDAGIDVLARDAVATKELTAIFVPFVAVTLFTVVERLVGPFEGRVERFGCWLGLRLPGGSSALGQDCRKLRSDS